MDTKTVLLIMARGLLYSLGGVLAAHGTIQSSGVEQFVSAGLVLGAAGLSVWDKWGRPILEAQLEVWKMKAEDLADALRAARVPVPPPPTAAKVDAATSKAVDLSVATAAIASTEVSK